MLMKKHIKSRNVCKVTFEVPIPELPEAPKVESVAIAGDFNDWDATATPMAFSKKKNAYRTTVELKPGQQYQFRYLVNDLNWCNDWNADGYEANGFGEDNSVLWTPDKPELSL